jgi:TonB family protein
MGCANGLRLTLMAAALAGVGGAAAAQAVGAGGTPSASPLTVHPPATPRGKAPPPAATIAVPSDETAMGHYASVWPRAAYEARIAGSVTLRCDIDRYGLAETCEVAAETPAGKGFGRAALLLRPTFKLPPARDASGPIDSTMLIAVDFKPPDTQVDVLGDSGGQGAIAECGGLGKPCPEL